MNRKPVFLMIPMLFLVSISSMALGVQRVEASGIIYIRADGSIEPSTARISTTDNITYTFTWPIFDSIEIERDNIVVDGAGYVLMGTGVGSTGIRMLERSNVTIRNMTIIDFENGILLKFSSNNSIFGNTIIHNGYGIRLYSSSNYNGISENNITYNSYGIILGYSSNYNGISGNNITTNTYGVYFDYSSNNTIYQNNFIDNGKQAYMYNLLPNFWDDGYPSGGNHWSDYNGTDSDPDGTGDTEYVIDTDNVDHYPLMAPITFFDAGTWNNITYYFNIVSNSTVSHFYFDPDEGAFVRFWVKGETEAETDGFCRVAIPKNLLWVDDGWTVLYGSYLLSYKPFSDENYTYLYFTYTNPSQNVFTTVTINGTNAIPEFPSFLILPLLMIATLLATIVYKRKQTT